MRRKIIIYLLLLLFSHPLLAQKTRITFVGNSITFGAQTGNPSVNSYPAQLQNLLGEDYLVNNFGVSSTTILKKGNLPYWTTPAYKEALQSKPDIVFIALGINDSKSINRPFYEELTADSRSMIRSFKELPSNPRVILMLPTASFRTDSLSIWDPVVIKEIAPRLRMAAYDEDIELIDMHPLLIDSRDLVPDKIHPDSTGSARMAHHLYKYLSQSREKEDYDIFLNLPDFKKTNFYGFSCAEFEYEGHQCKIVKPQYTAIGHPWVWRARFWGHQPQVDIALLEQGYHVVYCDTEGLMGNAESVAVWNSFYSLLVKNGLYKKCVLEGMSRGAMYALNWAAENPDKVDAVYIDNPLLDVRYLAHRPKQLEAMTQDLLKAYNLKDRQDLSDFAGNPIDKTDAIAKGNYPILILSADEDEAVDHQQALDFKQKVEQNGGHVNIIIKKGFKHHPHCLPNPTSIIDFILDAKKYQNKK